VIGRLITTGDCGSVSIRKSGNYLSSTPSATTRPAQATAYRRTRPWLLSSYDGQTWLFLLPFLLGSLLLVVLPALVTVGIAFTHYNAIEPPRWAGLENFQRLLNSPLARLSLRSSLQFLFLAVPARLLGALLMAVLLQRGGRFFTGSRAATYLPTIIPEGAYALLWLWILNPLFGPLNLVLGWLGLPQPQWLVESGPTRMAFVLMSLFTLGEGMVVLLVGLRTIPKAYYEAARVDGAGALRSFTAITLPLLLPWMVLLALRDLVVSLQNTFTASFVITYGGPYYATTYIPLLLYELAFDFFDFGLAAALLVVSYLITSMLVVGIINLVGLDGQDHAD
jgi:multiple sugar transport system permease protein